MTQTNQDELLPEQLSEQVTSELQEAPAATWPTFADRWLRPTIVEALAKKGYTTPTPIQELTFKHFTDGHHIVGESQTWSGKTAAFLLPILNAMNLKEAAPQVLVLAPTRELALQTEEEAFELTRGLFGAKTALVCGGLSFRNQIQRVQRGANVIIGTPGRVLAMIEKRLIQTNQVHYLVLDEVDRMLDMWFIDEVEAIWSKLPKSLRALCFSATMPYEVKALFDRFLVDGYQHIQIEKKQITVDQLDHSFVRIPELKKLPFLESYLTAQQFDKIIVFAQTKRSVNELQNIMRVEWYEVFGLHGDVDQYERINAMKAVKAAKKVILVATDVASRGLNLNDVDLVVNFDMPQDPEDYVHRVWRTARAWKSGKAIMFVTPSEDRKLKQLERANKLQIKEVDEAGNVIPRPQEHARGGSHYGWGGRRRQPRNHSGGRRFGHSGWSGNARRFDDTRSSYGNNRPSRPQGDRPAYGGWERRSYNNERPSYGSNRFETRVPQRSSGSSQRPAYGWWERRSYNNDRPSYGSREKKPYGAGKSEWEKRRY